MSKKIHTIQSSNKKEFDKQVNQFLEFGCELLDGGYKVINNNDDVVDSKVVVLKGSDNLLKRIFKKWKKPKNKPSQKR